MNKMLFKPQSRTAMKHSNKNLGSPREPYAVSLCDNVAYSRNILLHLASVFSPFVSLAQHSPIILVTKFKVSIPQMSATVGHTDYMSISG